MHHQLLSYKESLISYYRFGSGAEPVICFHGYGETAGSFAFLAKEAGTQYTFHSLGLPFHGHTQWRQGLDFRVGDLLRILSLIDLPKGKKPVLLGFSLGGRVALTLYQHQPSSSRKLVLIAPDGLRMNPWYWLATQTFAGNRLFRFTMKHPGWFFALLKSFNKTGRVNASVFKFVNAYIGNSGLRLLLYQRWTVLRKLRPDLKKIKQLIRENKTPVQFLYGKYDRIILSSRGDKFRKGIEEYCHIEILPAGHQVLQPQYSTAIIDALK